MAAPRIDGADRGPPSRLTPETANYDVWLNLSETPEGLRGWFEYSTDLFDAATITRMGEHLQTLLEGIVAHPEAPLSHLPLLRPDEQHRLLVEWNALKRLLDHYGAQKAHIAGLAMGGMIAQDFYSLYPERMATLVLCDMG